MRQIRRDRYPVGQGLYGWGNDLRSQPERCADHNINSQPAAYVAAHGS